ncbi:unnamed protein product [Prunus brigantina]
MLMLFFGEGQLREKWDFAFSREKNGNFCRVTVKGRKVVTLFTRVLCPFYREVKVGCWCRFPMWDFVQVAAVVTRVMEIRFSSL